MLITLSKNETRLDYRRSQLSSSLSFPCSFLCSVLSICKLVTLHCNLENTLSFVSTLYVSNDAFSGISDYVWTVFPLNGVRLYSRPTKPRQLALLFSKSFENFAGKVMKRVSWSVQETLRGMAEELCHSLSLSLPSSRNGIVCICLAAALRGKKVL